VTEISIRPLASADDIDYILAIEHASFTNPWTREMYLAELASPKVSRFLLAANAATQIVGFCAYWLVVDELHINNLAVLPEWRQRGFGRALLAAAVEDARRHGAVRALLEVRRSNLVAQRLYEHAGFEVARVRHEYYTQPVEDALVLACEPLPYLNA
jgi:[ribosomal protein S18]-alanine N-acetyltransferase